MTPSVRRKVDPSLAKETCEAVQSKKMTALQAQKAFGISRKSIIRRLNGDCAMDASVGPATVLRREEEEWIVDTLLYAAHNHLGLSRSDLVEAVRKLCSDGRQVPRKPEQGPGPKWVRGFLKRHPQLSERSFTSPVMCLGVIFFFDIIASDAHNMHTKCGLLKRSRTCAISTYVKMCLIS